jgi:hypothetical protein
MRITTIMAMLTTMRMLNRMAMAVMCRMNHPL